MRLLILLGIDDEAADDEEPDFSPRKVIHIHRFDKTPPNTGKPDQTGVANSPGAVPEDVVVAVQGNHSYEKVV